MPCNVIIIGYDTNNRLSPALTAPATMSPLVVGVQACSKNCAVSKVAVLCPDAAEPQGYKLVLDGSKPAKPAEAYVLTFASGSDAASWLHTAVDRTQLVGKTVLVIDPESESDSDSDFDVADADSGNS